MLLMLGCAAVFVYAQLRADLDDSIDASLRSRAEALVGQQDGPSLGAVGLEDSEETFVQLMSPTGTVLDSVGTLPVAALSPRETLRASAETVVLERDLPGVDGRTRLLARRAGGNGGEIVVVGRSLLDRNEALSSLVNSFAIGGAVAILLASMIGYIVATAGLAPVEAMRRRARDVSLLPSDTGLPLPAARDEIRRLGETLNEMLDRLRTAYERESRFVADASHELRTPIAIIKTELENAVHDARPQTPAYESLVAATEECDRLTQLAEDLLIIARASDGQLPVRPEPIPARALLAGVRDRFADRAARRGRTIRVDAEPDLLVPADPVRLRQALGNLVENALRHGTGAVAMVARSAAGGIEIDVADEGPGLPPGFAAHAFERFARGDRTHSGEGVGLGLAIVQAIAQAHGGCATVLGTAPTTLRVHLPSNPLQPRA